MLLFVTRLIINKIDKVKWVDFKLENVLVSLHSLKTMGLGSINSPIRINSNVQLYNNTPSNAIVNAASDITYKPVIEADGWYNLNAHG